MNKKILALTTIIVLVLSIFAIKTKALETNNTQTENNIVVKQKIGKEEDWKYNIELPKYDENGAIIMYEVDEEDVPKNYTKRVEGEFIINTLDQYNYKVEYYYDGKLDETKTDIISAFYGSKIDDFTDKSQYGYILEKTEGLGLTIGPNEKDNIIRIYYETDKINFCGTKVWADNANALGLRPSTYCIKLYADGEYLTEKTFTSDNWDIIFTYLPKYNHETGEEINYSFQEDEVILENGDRYIPTINKNIVTNTLTGTTQIEVKKIWEDNENSNHTRPDNIEIIIRRILWN